MVRINAISKEAGEALAGSLSSVRETNVEVWIKNNYGRRGGVIVKARIAGTNKAVRLFVLTAKGELYRCKNVPAALGFKLDSQGRIALEG